MEYRLKALTIPRGHFRHGTQLRQAMQPRVHIRSLLHQKPHHVAIASENSTKHLGLSVSDGIM